MKIHWFFVFQPACLPAIRPTSSGRIGPVNSYNTEYRCTNTDLLFQLRFIHCAMVSPFILHCFSFSLTGEQKVRNHWRGVNKLYILYWLRHTNDQMHMYLIASFIKLITKHKIFATYRFKSARLVSCWDLYACFWAVICQYSCC